MSSSSLTSITYQRANGLFAVASPAGVTRVAEHKLRAIGDMDITEAIEAAKFNPGEPQEISRRVPTGRGL